MLGLASGIMVAAFVIIGIALLVAFIFVEKKADSPVVPLSVFMNKALVGDFILFALAWGAYISVNTYLPMWSQAILGTSALIGGMTLIPNSIWISPVHKARHISCVTLAIIVCSLSILL